MDPETLHTGLPYSGVGFICKKHPGVNYVHIDVDNDRLSVLQLMSKGSIVVTILGVYLPYFNGQGDQAELYTETFDCLQNLCDIYVQKSPIMILGDFYAALPQQTCLTAQWYKQKPYNSNSLLLYDFICDNDLIVSNFKFEQPVNYTYCKGNGVSYLDHVLVSRDLDDCVSSCFIYNDFGISTSDHLPIVTSLYLTNINCDNMSTSQSNGSKSNVTTFPHANWRNVNFVNIYKNNIDGCVSKCVSDFGDKFNVINKESVSDYVNIYCDKIVCAIHEAVQLSGDQCRQSFKGRKRQHWWNIDYKLAKDRQIFWYKIWKSCGKPRDGAVFESYKYAKYNFRKYCRLSFKRSLQKQFDVCDQLYKDKRTKKFWNLIQKSRNKSNCDKDNISDEILDNHFREKFSYNVRNENDFVQRAREFVNNKLGACNDEYDFVFTEYFMKKFIRKLKPGCSPGIDGVSAEHLKFVSDSSLIKHLCRLFTVCFRFGVVPNSITKGLLIPLLKKPSLDQGVPKNYRPVIVSTTFSKLIELYILYECKDFEFSDQQFGFVSGRGTNAAIALAHDIGAYYVSRGSQIYMCGLDAEGAFDGIPHPVLFQKSYGVISEMCWKLLVHWYNVITVQVKWKTLSNPIQVCKGTRQGRLSSPFLFNLFYKDLVDILSQHEGGVTIGNIRYNIVCYADDLLLLS